MADNDRHALILMAHADDETLGAGGTIAHLLKTGWVVDVVLLTDGRVSTRVDRLDENSSDAFEACRILGCNEPTFLGFADQKFDTYPIADLANAVFEVGHTPDLIITHSPNDLNGDHKITFDVAMIVGRPQRKPISILGVEIPKNNFWNGVAFSPNFYVDISEHLPVKLTAFAAYSNEIKEYPHAFSLEGLELLAKYHGFHSGYEAAEAFQLIRGYDGLLP